VLLHASQAKWWMEMMVIVNPQGWETGQNLTNFVLVSRFNVFDSTGTSTERLFISTMTAAT
jgi:hypothetical protein